VRLVTFAATPKVERGLWLWLCAKNDDLADLVIRVVELSCQERAEEP
jgi:hypothetical protein